MIGVTALDKLYPAPKDGKPGNDAVVYSIVCSNTNPNVTDSDVSVTLTAYMTVGSERKCVRLMVICALAMQRKVSI